MTLRISGAKARNGVDPSQARFAGVSPAVTVEGGTTAAVVASYLQRVLPPALRPGQLEVFSCPGGTSLLVHPDVVGSWGLSPHPDRQPPGRGTQPRIRSGVRAPRQW